MSGRERQARWRAQRRERGSRPLTIWLNQSTLHRLEQLSQQTKAPSAYTLQRAIDFAFGNARDAYWYTVRQEWAARNGKQGEEEMPLPARALESPREPVPPGPIGSEKVLEEVTGSERNP